MPRVKGGTRQKDKHKKVLKATKGFRGSRNRLYKRAHEAYVRKFKHAFEGRKQKRRDFRRLWIARINAALTEHGMLYSRFIDGLNKAGLDLNRKTLSEMAIHDPTAFAKIVEIVKQKTK